MFEKNADLDSKGIYFAVLKLKRFISIAATLCYTIAVAISRQLKGTSSSFS